MQDLRVAGVAIFATCLTLADLVIPTPEDLAPFIGWIDEVALLGLSAKLWLEFVKGTKLEELWTGKS